MRVIEKRWKYLASGYKKLRSLGVQLDAQWKRSVQVAQRRKFMQEYAIWKRNRLTLLLLVLGFVLGCSLLCGFAYFAEEWNMQCLYSFWAFILFAIGSLFALLRRNFVRSVFTRPALETFTPPSQRLEQLWWKNLEPRSILAQNAGAEGIGRFLGFLEDNLPDTYIAIPEILTSIKKVTDTDVLLLGPSGIWVFEVKHWYGTIYKREGVWWHVVSKRRIDHLQDSGEKKQGPDEQWTNQVREIKTTLKRRRPNVAWTTEIIRGGVVFSNPGAILNRSNIQGNSAPYGQPRNWLDRINKEQAVQGFNTEVQLQILEALIEYGLSIERDEIIPASAIRLSEGAYQKISQELTEFIKRWAK